MHGWTGKILLIDLNNKKTSVIKPSTEIYENFVGGRGLAGHYLKPYIKETWDSPEMPLLIFTGPLVNTPSPTSGRITIMSRSPLTGTIGDTSVGGKFGTQLKKAGWDGIIITGKSSEFCSIEITNEKIEFTDATDLTHLITSQCLNKISPKDGSVAMIGPAAINECYFANIVIDGHFFAGRMGLGLVMANKKIKYIQVKGSGKTEIANKNELTKAREEIFRLVSASPILKGHLGLSELGTGAVFDLIHTRKMMPTDNFKESYFEDADTLNAFHYKQKYNSRKTGCVGCHILCKRKNANNIPLPEFETMALFTALIKNRNIETVVQANILCNEYGMDTISTAGTLACYSEINNITLSHDDILNLITDIALSRNEGEELRVGSYRYAKSKGKPHASMTVKGLEIPAYDPRGAYGMALAYVTSTRGACHLRAYPISHEILRKPVATDRFSFEGKARIIKLSEDINTVVDSLTACKFIFFAATLEEYALALQGVTGMKTTAQDLLKTGERIYNNERAMNAMNGFSVKDDVLPERFFTIPGTIGGEINVPPLNRDDFLKARANYYKIRG